MNARFAGVVSGIGAGEAVEKIELVWKAGEESEANAISAGRTAIFQVPTDDAKISAFQGAGQVVDIGTLSPGVSYTPAVRITEKRADLSLVTGAWNNGTAVASAPAAPTAISAQSGSGTLTITWTAGTGATSSLIRYGTASGVYGTTIDPTTSPRTISGLTNGQTVYYQVGAKNGTGITWSAEMTAAANASPVFTAQPTQQSATTTSITVAYGTSDNESDAYRLDYSTNNGSSWVTGAVSSEAPGAGKTYTIGSLAAGTTHTVLLRLTPLTGNVAAVTSNSLSAVTIPSAPTITSVVAGIQQNVITLGTVAGATSYNLYWTLDGSTPTTASTKITGAVSPHTHSSLTNGLTYKYIQTAVNAAGESAASAVVSGIPVAAAIGNGGFESDVYYTGASSASTPVSIGNWSVVIGSDTPNAVASRMYAPSEITGDYVANLDNRLTSCFSEIIQPVTKAVFDAKAGTLSLKAKKKSSALGGGLHVRLFMYTSNGTDITNTVNAKNCINLFGDLGGVEDDTIKVAVPTQNQLYTFTYNSLKTFAQAALLSGRTWTEVDTIRVCVTAGYISTAGGQFYIDDVSLV